MTCIAYIRNQGLHSRLVAGWSSWNSIQIQYLTKTPHTTYILTPSTDQILHIVTWPTPDSHSTYTSHPYPDPTLYLQPSLPTTETDLLSVAVPLDGGRRLAFDVHVKLDVLARLGGRLPQAGAVDLGLHCTRPMPLDALITRQSLYFKH